MVQVQNPSRVCGGFKIRRENPKSGQRSENDKTNAIIAAIYCKIAANVTKPKWQINAITAAFYCKIATKASKQTQ